MSRNLLKSSSVKKMIFEFFLLGISFGGGWEKARAQSCCSFSAAQAWVTPTATVVNPWGVAVDQGRQRVYVTGATSNNLMVYQYDGTLVKEITGLTGAVGVAVGSGPTPGVFVGLRDPGVSGDRVVEYDPDNNWSIKGGMSTGIVGKMRGIAVDGSGKIFTSEDGAVIRVYNGSPTPTPVATMTGLNDPTGMWKTGNELDVANTTGGQVIQVIETPGPSLGYGGLTPVVNTSGVQGVTRDNSGNYYVTSGIQYAVYDSHWNLVTTCSKGEFSGANGIGIDENYAIYVAGTNASLVRKMDPCSLVAPTPTATFSNPPSPGGCFIYPSPVRGDHATVAYDMAESGKVEVKVWNEKAELVAEVNDSKPVGLQRTAINPAAFATGVYYYQLVLTYDSGKVEKIPAHKFVVLH